MENTVEIQLNKKNIIVMEEGKALEFCTEEYFKGNENLRINGKKFDIFDFGNFDFRKKAKMLV